MKKWQKKYLDRLKLKSNEELLEEYTSLARGDDYDGCYTKEGTWQWNKIQEVLREKLVSIGFLPSNNTIPNSTP